MNYLNYHTGRPRFHFDGGTPPPPAPPTPPASAWHTGIEPETLGFWQNKGYDLTDPLKFGTAITKQYRDLEKHIGAPPDQIVRMPKADAPPEEFRAYYERLGAPKEAKDYDLSAVKDPAIAESLRATAHAAGLSKDAAAKIAAELGKSLESKSSTDATLATAKLAEEKGRLEVNWGGKDSAKYNVNLLQANEGARRVGITPDAVKALENQIGYAAVMEHFRKIGAATSEDTFVEREGGGGNGVATREGAMSRKNELMNDPAWTKRFTSGDAEAKREYDRLNALIGE